jgi:hypothetical protein
MLTCPMCKKPVAGALKHCQRCGTDVTLLVDYVAHLEDGLGRAEALTREGKLGEAVWAYLTVLEVDPDNPAARRQVGQVATAVRQFDEASPGRRWLRRLRRQARPHDWMASWHDGRMNWEAVMTVGLLVLAALACGFLLGYHVGHQRSSTEPAQTQTALP